MSFSGKKFRRIRCENIDTLVRQSNASPRLAYLMKAPAPVFSFTRLNEDEFLLTIHINDRTQILNFRLGKEVEVERMDGTKLKMIYTLESENVMNQVVYLPEGKTAYFRREFGETEAVMILRMDGAEAEAKIYYEVIE